MLATVAIRVVPFSEIDEACLSASLPDSPFNIEIELALAGRVDLRQLRTAVRHAIRCHPMAGARQLPARPLDRHYRWELTDGADVDPVVTRASRDRDGHDAARESALSAALPLDRSPPFRLFVRQGPQSDTLLLSASHVAMDGMGALRLVSAIASAYIGRPDQPADRDATPHQLFERHLARPLSTSWFDRMATARNAYADNWLEGSVRLVGGVDAPEPGFHVVHLRLPRAVADELRPTDHAIETRNDLLLAALTRAIERWNNKRGGVAGRVTIMVPVNLRPDDAWSDVVGNVSVAAVVTTGPADRRDDASLIASVRHQTAKIKADAARTGLVDIYRMAAMAPVFWKQSTAALLGRFAIDRTMPTAVLSNLGTPEHPLTFGDAGAVRELWFSPPCRAPTSLAVGAVCWRGALFMSLRFHRAAWARSSAVAFARELADTSRALTDRRPRRRRSGADAFARES